MKKHTADSGRAKPHRQGLVLGKCVPIVSHPCHPCEALAKYRDPAKDSCCVPTGWTPRSDSVRQGLRSVITNVLAQISLHFVAIVRLPLNPHGNLGQSSLLCNRRDRVEG